MVIELYTLKTKTDTPVYTIVLGESALDQIKMNKQGKALHSIDDYEARNRSNNFISQIA